MEAEEQAVPIVPLAVSGFLTSRKKASAAELALELLFLTRKLAKQPSDDGTTVSYG